MRFSRPSEAPEPTTNTCRAESIIIASRGMGLRPVIASATVGTGPWRRSSHQPQPASAPPIIGPLPAGWDSKR